MSEKGTSEHISFGAPIDLQAFLETQPSNEVVAVALRAAWRALPFIVGINFQDALLRAVFSIFRATVCAHRGGAAVSIENAVLEVISTKDYMSDEDKLLQGPTNAVISAAVSSLHAAKSNHGMLVGSAIKAISHSTYLTNSIIWEETKRDIEFLRTGGKSLISRALWQEFVFPFYPLLDELEKQLSVSGAHWNVLAEWYRGIISDASQDPFPSQVLDEIAKESLDFWGGRNFALRSPDDVMRDIAARLSWAPEPSVLKDSPTEPSFIPSDPIEPDRDGPVPLVPRDHDYFHSAAQKRCDQLQNEISNEGAAGEQALRLLAQTLPEIQSALGPTAKDSFMTALAGEADTLKGLIKTQEDIAAVPEKDRDFEDPLWAKHIKGIAEDLLDKLHKLLDNDKRASILSNQTDDEPPTEADADFIKSARKAIEEFAAHTDLFAPETIELLKRYLERGEEAVRAGARAVGRPISFLRGLLGNLANAIARGTKYVWDRGGGYVAGVAGAAYIITSTKTAIIALETLSKTVGTNRLDTIIAILKSVVGGV